MKNAVVQDLIDANKLVRTQKQYNNVPLHFPSNIERPMGESQGHVQPRRTAHGIDR